MGQFGEFRNVLILGALLISAPLSAQELRLFEAVEAPASTNNPTATETREQRNFSSAPTFTLIGTSRIGGKLKTSLVDNSGNVIHVIMTDQERTPIPSHPGYSLVRVGSRSVAISLPDGTSCTGAPDKGVECDAGGLAQLSLTTAAPIAVVATTNASAESNDENAASTDEQPENPFAAALRAAAQNEAATRGRGGRAVNERFEVRRISPEDVPPGKRVVRTPFGDRLVDL